MLKNNVSDMTILDKPKLTISTKPYKRRKSKFNNLIDESSSNASRDSLGMDSSATPKSDSSGFSKGVTTISSSSDSTENSSNIIHFQDFSFSVLTGFKNKRIEAQFLKPFIEHTFSVAFISCFGTLVFCIIVFGLGGLFRGPVTDFFELGVEITFENFFNFTLKKDRFEVLCLYVSLGFGTIVMLVCNFISIYFWICKKKYSIIGRYFIEFTIALWFQIGTGWIQLMQQKLYFGGDDRIKLSNFNTSFFLINFFQFFGLPFYDHLRYFAPFKIFTMILFTCSYIIIQGNSYRIAVFDIIYYLVSYFFFLVIKFMNEDTIRRSFSLKMEDMKTREELKIAIVDISNSTNTLIPLKCFQKKVFEVYNINEFGIKKKKNSSLYSANGIKSDKYFFEKTIFLQVDLVNFTEFCNSYIGKKNPYIIATTLEKIFSAFDRIIEHTPFRCVSIVGDAYVTMFQKSIILYDDDDNNILPDNNDMLLNEVVMSKFDYIRLLEFVLLIGEKMIDQCRGIYPAGLRIGICEEECYSQLFFEDSNVKFDVYGKGFDLVDYLQKLAQIDEILICKNIRNSINQIMGVSASRNFEFYKFYKENYKYEKNFSCPKFYEKNDIFNVKVAEKNVSGNDEKGGESESFLYESHNFEYLSSFNDLVNFFSAKENYSYGIKSVLSNDSILESRSVHSNESNSQKYYFTKKVKKVKKKVKKVNVLRYLLLLISDMYDIVTFKTKNGVANTSTPLLHKRKSLFNGRIFQYINLTTKMLFKYSLIINILCVVLLALNCTAFYFFHPSYFKFKRYHVFWIFMLIVLAIYIFLIILNFFEYYLYFVKGKKYFSAVHFALSIMRYLTFASFIFLFEMSDSEITFFFIGYNFYIVVIVLSNFAFTIFREFYIITGLVIFIISVFLVFYSYIGYPMTLALNRIPLYAAVLIVFIPMNIVVEPSTT